MLSVEETNILKLVAAKTKARVQLAKVNMEMGEAIRSEFKVIDARIRKEREPLYLPLELVIKQIDDDLKALLE